MTSKFMHCIPLLFAAAVLSFTNRAGATPKVQFCGKWLTNYQDSDDIPNSDWSWEKGTMGRWAQFTRTYLTKKNGSSWNYVSTHYLNEPAASNFYCTEPVTVEPGASYRFWMLTKLEYGNREIVIMGDGSTWANPGVRGYRWEFEIPSDLNTTVKKYAHPQNTTHLSKQSSMAHVARQLMAMRDKLEWPNASNQKILVNMDGSECSGGHYDSYVSPYHRICLPYPGDSIEKFVAGHELGHAIHHMHVASFGGALGTADDPSPPSGPTSFWASPHLMCARPSYSHFIQSREYIGLAQQEGFAHFVGAALFNAREPYAGFKCYRDQVYYTPPGGTFGAYNKPWLDWGNYDRWLDDHCTIGSNWMSGFTGLGVEWDWAQFFWHLWAHGSTETRRWEVSQIFDVWNATSKTNVYCTDKYFCAENINGNYELGRLYEDLADSMVGVGSAIQEIHWRDVASQSGVNYNDY